MPNTIASAKIGDDAASAVEQRVLGWCRSHEGASVTEKREAAKLIMEGFVQTYDDKAAEFAPQWYDHPHSRAARGSSRPARLNPHPRLAHTYHERFLFLEVSDARQLQRRQARQTHSRRNREPHCSLRQLQHHGDEFSSEYKKNPSLALMLSTSSNN